MRTVVIAAVTAIAIAALAACGGRGQEALSPGDGLSISDVWAFYSHFRYDNICGPARTHDDQMVVVCRTARGNAVFDESEWERLVTQARCYGVSPSDLHLWNHCQGTDYRRDPATGMAWDCASLSKDDIEGLTLPQRESYARACPGAEGGS